MKIRLFTVVAVACLGLLAVSCSDREIDTAKIRAAMQSVADQPKAKLEEALTDIDAHKYKEALPVLRSFAYSAKLDKNQRKIIENTKEKLSAKIAKGE